MTVASTELPSTKGSTLRGYLRAIESLGLRSSIEPLLTPRTAALFADPPLPTEWVSLDPLVDRLDAVRRNSGANMVRQVARRNFEQSLSPLLRPVLQGLLGVFGSSPHILLERIDMIIRNSGRGVTCTYTQSTPRSGTVVIRYIAPVDPVLWNSWAGLGEALVAICDVQPVVRIRSAHDNNREAEFSLSW
jgi:hypothetical protein